MKEKVILVIVLIFIFSSVNAQVRNKYLPNNYVKVEGDSISGSYYVSRTLVTNFEYKIYLKWVENVVGLDYPTLYKMALPDTTLFPDGVSGTKENYFWSSTYDGHPVIGLTYKQCVDYSYWYTDRLNEYVMYKEGVLLEIEEYVTSDSHFTTGSYLAGLYLGSTSFGVMIDRFGGEYNFPSWESGLYFPAFRTPTKHEFDIATLVIEEFDSIDYTFPKGYFLNNWVFGKSKKLKYSENTTINEWLLDKPSDSLFNLNYIDVYNYNGQSVDYIKGDTVAPSHISQMPYHIVGEDSIGRPLCIENKYYNVYPWDYSEVENLFRYRLVKNRSNGAGSHVVMVDEYNDQTSFRLVIAIE